MDERLAVSATVEASATRIFAVITDPGAHVDIDGSGMLVAAAGSDPVSAVGDTFVMHMDREPLGDLPMGKYDVLNTVTRFEPDRLLEWTVGAQGRSPIGHVYGYELDAESPGRTIVTSYCDWSNLNPKLRDRVSFPIVPASMMQQTLARLRLLVEGAPRH